MKQLLLKSLARQLIVTVFVVALFSVAVSVSRAQQQNVHQPTEATDAPARARDAHRPNLLTALNLTPEQITRFREIKLRNQAERQRLQRAQRLARFELDEAIYASESSPAFIEEKMRVFSTAHAALTRFDINEQLQIKQLLTPDQLQTFRNFRSLAARRQQQRDRQGDTLLLHERLQRRRAEQNNPAAGRGAFPRRNRLRGNPPTTAAPATNSNNPPD